MIRFALLLLAFALASPIAAAEGPNVLLICVDDLKPALGCYGDALAKTPNIDRLAARGLLFERAYCNQAVCSPSRNALLVGVRPQTMGIYDLGTNFRVALPDAVTLPQRFKQAGYHCEGLGKIFHVGQGNRSDEASWSTSHRQAKGAIVYALKENAAERDRPRGAAFESADVPDDAYADGQLAAAAIGRLQAAAKRPDTPLFLAIGFIRPHLPFCAPKKYWDLHDPAKFPLPDRQKPPAGAPSYAPTTFGELRQYKGTPQQGPVPDELARKLIHGYYAATSYMDAQLGRVLDELDRLKLADNTIVVLWGDHGWHLGDHGMWCKHTNYEQAARIPLVIVAPGMTKPGTRTAALAESVDIYPTLCELAGLEAQSPQKLDGDSLAPVLRDPAAPGKDFVLHAYPRGPRIGRALRTSRYRLVEWKQPGAAADEAELELYDYQSDPAEAKNLAADEPRVTAELRDLLMKQPEAKPQIKK